MKPKFEPMLTSGTIDVRTLQRRIARGVLNRMTGLMRGDRHRGHDGTP